jgi:hypothetical protein
MTLKKMGQPTRAKLFAAVLLATCALTVAAYAQPTFVGKFTLAYEVHWGQVVLPAGDYSIRMDSVAGPAKIMPASGGWAVYTESPITADSEKGGTYLTLTILGNEHRVHSMNLPPLGKSVIFSPLTKSEREELAKGGQINSVPVVTARK